MKKPIKFVFLLLPVFWGGCLMAQVQDRVDFTHAAIEITINPVNRIVSGEVRYTLNTFQNTDSVFLDARNMCFNKVLLNGKKVRFTNNSRYITIHKKLKKDRSFSLQLSFEAQPIQTVYFLGWNDESPNNNQVWTQGQGKYTSHWLPSFDEMTEKVEFDISITFDKHYDVIANGKLLGTQISDSLKTWNYDMDKPMSSYLLAFAIGTYQYESTTSSSGIPIALYYYPQDSTRVEPTYRYSRKLFDLLEREIGVPYPWQNYKQVPVRDFLYAGMENTGTTLFSDSFMIDSIAFTDHNYVNVNAHELAHQWFGNLVTEKSGDHHWLHEGFATYYALLAEKELFGADYYYWQLYDKAVALQDLSERGEGEALTDAGASSITFYDKGAWALYCLKEEIGTELFRKGIKAFLQRFKFKNAGIGDFLAVMEEIGGTDLSKFREQWLDSSIFPMAEVQKELALASQSLAMLFKMQRELTSSSEENEAIIMRYWKQSDSNILKARIATQYYKSLSEDFIRMALQTGITEIRRAIALSGDRIPIGLKSEYETLLKDPSYRTVESVLMRLWLYCPEDRATYLRQTRNIIGLPNKNVRLLWLTLAILTPDFEPDRKPLYLNELAGYTATWHPFEVRLLAFQYLRETFSFTDKNLKDLVNAAIHPAWQFRNFARNLLDELLEDESQKKRIIALSKELNEPELRYLSTKLKLE